MDDSGRPLTIEDLQSAVPTPIHETSVCRIKSPLGPVFVCLVEKPNYDPNGRAYVYDAQEARRLAADLIREAERIENE